MPVFKVRHLRSLIIIIKYIFLCNIILYFVFKYLSFNFFFANCLPKVIVFFLTSIVCPSHFLNIFRVLQFVSYNSNSTIRILQFVFHILSYTFHLPQFVSLNLSCLFFLFISSSNILFPTINLLTICLTNFVFYTVYLPFSTICLIYFYI